MIRIRLAELLAERGIKITTAAKDTDIARSTLTSAAQNDSKMIQLDTINTLCKYLDIPIEDFFEYVPFDFEATIETTDFQLSVDIYDNEITEFEFDFDLFIDFIPRLKKDSKTYSLEGTSKIRNNVEVTIEFEKVENEKELIRILEGLPAGMRTQFTHLIKKTIFREFIDQCKEIDEWERKLSGNIELDFYSSSGLFPY